MINCESDFVSRGDEFQQLVKDVAMHIAAADPRYLTREDVPADDINKEREILMDQLKNDPKNAGKPEDVLNKIIEGRLNKFYEEVVLLDQPRQGSRKDDRRTCHGKDRLDQGKHHRSPLYPL